MKLIITSKDLVHVVRHQEILYCSSENSYSSIFLQNGDKLTVSMSLTKICKVLNSDSFVKISQSHLVNIEHVRRVDKRRKHIELSGSHRICFTLKIKALMGYLIGRNGEILNGSDTNGLNGAMAPVIKK